MFGEGTPQTEESARACVREREREMEGWKWGRENLDGVGAVDIVADIRRVQVQDLDAVRWVLDLCANRHKRTHVFTPPAIYTTIHYIFLFIHIYRAYVRTKRRTHARIYIIYICICIYIYIYILIIYIHIYIYI